MMHLWGFKDEQQKVQALRELIDHASPKVDFFGMVGLAVLMAALGMVMNNETVIIGSMLIAPIIFPLLTLALGMTLVDVRLLAQSIVTLLKAVVVSVGVAALIGVLARLNGVLLPSLVINRAQPSVLYALVAVIAGAAATLSYFRIRVKDYQPLPGVAISVALIPPLAAAGFGLAYGKWLIMWGALGVFGINVLGIVLTAFVAFWMLRIGKFHAAVSREVVREEKIEGNEL